MSRLSITPPGGTVQLVSVQFLKEADGNPEYCEYLLGRDRLSLRDVCSCPHPAVCRLVGGERHSSHRLGHLHFPVFLRAAFYIVTDETVLAKEGTLARCQLQILKLTRRRGGRVRGWRRQDLPSIAVIPVLPSQGMTVVSPSSWGISGKGWG